jgi:hypothetical protein
MIPTSSGVASIAQAPCWFGTQPGERFLRSRVGRADAPVLPSGCRVAARGLTRQY